jgi:hypothetical protein
MKELSEHVTAHVFIICWGLSGNGCYLEEVPPACQGPGQAGGWIMLAKEMGIAKERQFLSLHYPIT